MATEHRLVTQFPNRRAMKYGKRDRLHAETDLEYYLDAGNYTARVQPAAWIETREVTKWKKVEDE